MVNKLLGRLDVRAARALLAQPADDHLSTVEQTAAKFIDELNDALKEAKQDTIPNPWKEHSEEEGEPKSSVGSWGVDYDETGRVKDAAKLQLTERGFVIGAQI